MARTLSQPAACTKQELVEIVESIQAELWVEPVDPCDAEKGSQVNPDKEWSSDTPDAIARILRCAGLGPDED